MSKCKLGDLLKIKHGYAFKSENYVKSSKYRLITLGNFSDGNSFKYNDEKATYYGADFPSEFILQEGDLIMPLTEQVVGLFGNTAFVPKTEDYIFVLNQRVGKVIYDEKKVNKYYLHYLLATNSVKQQIEARASGTRQRNISPENVYDVEVDIPEIKVQEKIGNLLYLLEEKQINNNKINAELESMAKTIYDYWFLQFEFPNEEGKPYKSSGGKMVWNEELKREIPEGWEIKFCKDILDVITGKEDANHSTIDGEYPFFTCGIDPLKCDDYKFEGKMILIAGNGDFNVKYYEGKCNAYQRTYVLIPNEEKYIGLLYQNAIRKINSFKAGSNGSIVKFITKGDVEKIELLVPDNDKLMNTFNEILSTIEHYKKENQELASLRDFLLPLLMNGQVGFKEVTNG